LEHLKTMGAVFKHCGWLWHRQWGRCQVLIILNNHPLKQVGYGKPKKVAMIAVMRKLLILAYGLLKSETAFDMNDQS